MLNSNKNWNDIGFLPRLNNHFGQRYTVAATEALSEFQRVQLNQRAARNQLERVVDLQAGKGQPWDLVDRFVSFMQYFANGADLFYNFFGKGK